MGYNEIGEKGRMSRTATPPQAPKAAPRVMKAVTQSPILASTQAPQVEKGRMMGASRPQAPAAKKSYPITDRAALITQAVSAHQSLAASLMPIISRPLTDDGAKFVKDAHQAMLSCACAARIAAKADYVTDEELDAIENAEEMTKKAQGYVR